ncbi:MAG: 23S rRNA (adenine(2030)-N(6))-methyltransferase RlmJ [Cardiobacteriales bacterium]|nr:MAG: 23S rRNA (adenine(2030)-N(6))-methyltransferase RlmJ [Cardiobacteriales bacterium]
MLSYRHIFHAGNHADVLKHFCLYMVLDYYNQKNKPYVYFDTHAGIGCYNLNSPLAVLHKEFIYGIERLYNHDTLPTELNNFCRFIRRHSRHSHDYLGSAAIAAYMLRKNDQLRLFEHHPQDFLALQQYIDKIHPQARALLASSDGLKGLIANLPPYTRRGVILIDPAYEIKTEYPLVIEYVTEALKRFPQGCYIIWYPQLSRLESKHFSNQLHTINSEDFLHVTLTVSQAPVDGFGMYGSGLYIINPPYVLPKILSSLMPSLVSLLGRDAQASYRLESQLS